MSTIATQLNWAPSYVINDLYRRFVRRDAGERDLVRLSRTTTLLMMCCRSCSRRCSTRSRGMAFIIEAGRAWVSC